MTEAVLVAVMLTYIAFLIVLVRIGNKGRPPRSGEAEMDKVPWQ